MQLEFNISNVQLFSNWLKRFSSIDKSLLLEVNLDTKQFQAKTYNEERSVVKFSKISFNDIGFELITKKIPEGRIKVGLYDIQKIIKTFVQFTNDFQLIIKYAPLKNKEGVEELAGKQVLLKNDTLKVGFDCTSLNIFKYITDTVFETVICKINSLLSFDLTQENFNKIISLSDLDKEYKRIEFKSVNNKVFLRSKSFELLLGVCGKSVASLPLLKDQFDKLDSENYQIALDDSRMVLTSIDSDTTTVLGGLDMNEYDTDKDMEL